MFRPATKTTYLGATSTLPTLDNLLHAFGANASILKLAGDEPVTFDSDEQFKLHVKVTLAVWTERDWKGAWLKRKFAMTGEGDVRNLVHEVTRMVTELSDDVAFARGWVVIDIAEESSLAEEFLERRPDNHLTSFGIDRFNLVEPVARLDLLRNRLEFGTTCKRCSKWRDALALAA